MAWLIIISYLLLLLLVKRIKDGISRTLFFIYVSFWCASLFLFNLNSEEFYRVEDAIYYLLLGHLFTFLFGFLTVSPNKNAFKKALSVDINVSKIVNNVPFISLFLLCYIMVIILFKRQRELLLIYSLADVRGDFMEMVLEGSALTFYSTVMTAMFHFCLCLFFYMLFFDRRWIYMFFFISYSLMFAFLGGGRHQLMIIAYYMIGFLILKNFILSSILNSERRYVFSKKIKILMLIGFVFSFLGMSAFTAMRNGESEYNKDAIESGMQGLFDTFISYSTGPFSAFNIGLKEKQFRETRHYGKATFGGTEDLLRIVLLKRIDLNYETSYNKVTGEVQNNRIMIGENKSWNYAYTSCFYYYCDFGIIGIFIFPFFLGLLTRLFFNMLERRLTIYSIAIYIFISFCFYDSVFTCYLHKKVSVFYIFILLLLHYSYRFRSSKTRFDEPTIST